MSTIDVLVLYNTPLEQSEGGACVWRESDAGVMDEMLAVHEALVRLGLSHRCQGVRRLSDVRRALAGHAGAVVFNLVERLDGPAGDFNLVPDLCVEADSGCTGSGSAALDLTFDKARTKMRLAACGLNVPEGVTVPPGQGWSGIPPFPLIVKPLCADGGEGIDQRSVVRDEAALAQAVARLHGWHLSALVERYVDGREVTAPILRRGATVSVLALAEIDFSLYPQGREHISDYEVKWIPGSLGPGIVSPRRLPALLDETLAGKVRSAACAAWEACGCGDYGRVDFRIAPDGTIFVLEVNANCDISPMACYPAALTAAGIGFDEFVGLMVEQARARMLHRCANRRRADAERTATVPQTANRACGL